MIKIAEYMALGKPIVQFNLREGRLTAGEASLYSDGKNLVRDFADKILWLLDHPEERERMGEFGRKRVEQYLSWEHSVGNLIAAYKRAFQKKVRRNQGPRGTTDANLEPADETSVMQKRETDDASERVEV